MLGGTSRLDLSIRSSRPYYRGRVNLFIRDSFLFPRAIDVWSGAVMQTASRTAYRYSGSIRRWSADAGSLFVCAEYPGFSFWLRLVPYLARRLASIAMPTKAGTTTGTRQATMVCIARAL